MAPSTTISSAGYTPAGNEMLVSWQWTQNAAVTTVGAGVVPLLFTASAATFDIGAIGSEQTSGGSFAWGVSLTGGTVYHFGFAQEDNLVNYSTSATLLGSSPDQLVPMDMAWIFGDPSSGDITDNGELAVGANSIAILAGAVVDNQLPFELTAHPTGSPGIPSFGNVIPIRA